MFSSGKDGAVINCRTLEEVVMAQAKSALDDFLSARRGVEDSLLSTYVLDEISTERLKRGLTAELLSKNLSDLYRAALHHELAYLLIMQNRYQDAIDNMRIAEELGFDRLGAVFSKSHLALMNGRVLDARSVLETVRIEDIPQVAREMLAGHMAQSGMLGKVMTWCDQSPDQLECNQAIASILKGVGVGDIEITKRLDLACRVIRENISHPILKYKLFAMEGEGILYRFVVKAENEALYELNEKIICALMDEFDDAIDRELSICVSPWSEEESFVREEPYRVGILE